MTASESKILTNATAEPLARLLKSGCFKLVITNGCFDILHVGHIRYLEAARALGDQLVVGVNTDWAVKALKGEGRPINPFRDRMAVLAALQCVSYVVPIDDIRVDGFIRQMRATTWVKGGDYTLDTLDQGEVKAARDVGTKIVILPVVQGVSTTNILKRV